MPISFIPYTAVYGPLSIGASCTLWLDAADTTTLQLSGSSVVQWNDKSGNMRNASGGVSPTYSPASNAIVFNGTSSYLKVPAATYAPLNAAFCVINYTGTTEGTVYRRGLSTGNTFEFGLSVLSTTQIRPSLVLSGSAREYIIGTSTTQQTMFCSTWDSSTYAFLKNGNTLISGTQSGTESTSSQPIAIGEVLDDTGQPLNTNYFTGNIYEIIFFNSVLSTIQRQAIEGYLAQKWGLTSQLPSGHPALSKTFYNGRVYQPQISLKSAPYANYYPLSVAGCQLWLDGTDPAGTGVQPANGSTISTWVNKSGSSLVLTTIGTPTYNSTQYGKGGIILNGSSYFQNTTFSFPLATRAIFLVANGTSGNTGLLAMTYTTVDYNNLNTLVYTTNGSKVVTFTEYYPSGFNVNFTSPVEPVLTSDSANGSNISYYGNGSLVQSLSSFTPTTSTGIFVGARNDQGGVQSGTNCKPMTGNINEVLLYNITLSTAQRQSIEGYLAWKWGLQASLVNTHPYYSAPPLQYTRGAILGAPTLTGISFVQSNYIGMTLTGSSAGAVTNYQIPITVYRTTGTNSGSSVYVGTAIYSDYSNLYFLASDRVTRLPFYIESSTITATSALIWVSVPTIPASPSTVKVYLYWYLSGTYTSSQNGTSTFLLFDEFTGSASAAPNSSIWTLNVKGSGGTGALTGSGTVQLSPTNSTVSSVSILSVNTLPANNFCIHVRRQYTGLQYSDITFAQTNSVQDLDAGGQSSWWHTTLAQGYLVEKQSANNDYLMIKGGTNTGYTVLSSGFGTSTTNTWELVDFSYTSSGLLTWAINGSTQASSTNTTYLSGSKYLLISQGMYSATSGYVTTVDYVFVRNYVSPEPSVTAWGSLNTP